MSGDLVVKTKIVAERERRPTVTSVTADAV
jgi:hypothetical protein